MPRMTRCPAAQYLRMSTEDQQCSIANQEAAIAKYARLHDFRIVRTYSDPGRSGIDLTRRAGLRHLLQDVISREASYRAILVYDVGRWGRFQDIDEGAHYEFICKDAGIPVHYCAEQFTNDGTPSSTIMKTLKRSMAAEYSRELGVKVYEGQRRLAAMGFKEAGCAPFGLSRLLISRDGRRRRKLKPGERKSIDTDRIVLVPGPKKQVHCVRRIFAMAVDKNMTPGKIAEF